MDLRFTGYSDDLFHVSYNGNTYEYDQYDPNETIVYTIIRSDKPDGVQKALKVTALYDRFGVWSFAPSMEEEGVPLLPARLTYFEEPAMSRDTSYCFGLGVAGIPQTATVTVYNKRGEDITEEGI